MTVPVAQDREVRDGHGRRSWGDVSLSAVLAGLIAVVVSFSGPLVIVLAAAKAGQLDTAQTGSWVWAMSIGSGLTCIVLSLVTKMPIITAFSTPGAALLVTGLPGHGYGDVVGAYLVASLLTAVVGLTGVFGWVMARIPAGLVAAMLAGILFEFGVGLFTPLRTSPTLAACVLATYLVFRRFSPRYAVAAALVVGLAVAAASRTLDVHVTSWSPTTPVLTVPHFALGAVVGIGLPLALTSLASQDAPGMAVLAASDYRPSDRLLVGSTGGTSLLLAPFGSHAVTLAAITAAICTGSQAHPDPRRRYVAGVACGVFYVLVGLFAGALVAVFTGLPVDLVAVLAGVALLSALTGGLASAVADAGQREAAVITFCVTASGVTLLGVSSAFWGIVIGIAAYLVLSVSRAPAA